MKTYIMPQIVFLAFHAKMFGDMEGGYKLLPEHLQHLIVEGEKVALLKIILN